MTAAGLTGTVLLSDTLSVDQLKELDHDEFFQVVLSLYIEEQGQAAPELSEKLKRTLRSTVPVNPAAVILKQGYPETLFAPQTNLNCLCQNLESSIQYVWEHMDLIKTKAYTVYKLIHSTLIKICTCYIWLNKLLAIWNL